MDSSSAAEAAAQAAPAPAKKELPPLLRARLAKRGILPQVSPELLPLHGTLGLNFMHQSFLRVCMGMRQHTEGLSAMS